MVFIPYSCRNMHKVRSDSYSRIVTAVDAGGQRLQAVNTTISPSP